MEIRPFKALRFNKDVVGNTGDCIAPPYDVISGEQQQHFYEKSDYNIVRIIKGKTSASDDDNNNQYTRAADYLADWIDKEALKADSNEAIYAYVQNFNFGDRGFQRLSFVASTKIEPFGPIVRPHEQTLSGPIIDRLNLNRTCGAKFGLVFMLYDDQQGVADAIIEKHLADDKPLIDFVDEQDVHHRLLAITDNDEIDTICRMMSEKSCVIADGHHRYTTSLAYVKENPDAKYQMIAFANMAHEGLIVLATHRLVANLDDYDFEKLTAELKQNFEITEFTFNSNEDKADAKQKMLSQMKVELDEDKNAFGIYSGTGVFSLAVLKDSEAMSAAAPDKSSAWRSLDVAVLHKLILEQLLGIGEKQLAAKTNLDYVKDTPGAIDESIAKVDAGEKQAAFFMNPPKTEQIQRVADAGEKMPQKSTYFYPKIYSGLTINKF